MTHYTTNGTAFLSTTTPFHSCATDLAFPVFRCASHPQMCNVDTVRSTEVGLIESRTSRASTGMQRRPFAETDCYALPATPASVCARWLPVTANEPFQKFSVRKCPLLLLERAFARQAARACIMLQPENHDAVCSDAVELLAPVRS